MPNIETHSMSINEFRDTEEKIKELIKNEPYEKETVITRVEDMTKDIKGVRQPFLRVFYSCADHIKDLLALLQTLHIDIEHSQVGFIPKK